MGQHRIIRPGKPHIVPSVRAPQPREIPAPPYWILRPGVMKVPCYTKPNLWRRFCWWAFLGLRLEKHDAKETS